MGQYFLMSKRLNKKTCQDFGLTQSNNIEIAINPIDGSLWKKCTLYDLGWGPENGFYKLPLPGFEQLIEIILNSDYDEDRYGAASIILNIYPAQLLEKSETLLFNYRNYQSVRNIKVLIKVFHLDEPTNKSPTLGKSFDEISKDFERWKSISDYINKQINVE